MKSLKKLTGLSIAIIAAMGLSLAPLSVMAADKVKCNGVSDCKDMAGCEKNVCPMGKAGCKDSVNVNNKADCDKLGGKVETSKGHDHSAMNENPSANVASAANAATEEND